MKRMLVLAMLVGCGSDPKPPTQLVPDPDPDPKADVEPAPDAAPPPLVACTDEAWGGWTGDKTCKHTAALVIPGPDRACTTDADCTLLGTQCDPHAVTSSRAASYEGWPSPCTNPASGQCMGPEGARCLGGCCTAQ